MQEEARMSGKVVHVGQVIVDLTLTIDALPEPGGDVFASSAGMALGGGYNVLYAARQLGVETVYAGTMGEGPFNDAALRGLAQIGVKHVGGTVSQDLGYCVALTDSTAERTFISTCGAETMDTPHSFDKVEIEDKDVVYVSGYSFASENNTASLLQLIRRLRGESRKPRMVFDVSPMVGSAPLEALETVRQISPIWSVNEREAQILARRFLGESELVFDEREVPAEEIKELKRAAFAALCQRLAAYLGTVVLRAGALGAWYCEGVASLFVPTPKVKTIDTNGAGDAHAGVLCAALARGENIDVALRWANIAGALSTTVRGPATCPTEEEIRALAS